MRGLILLLAWNLWAADEAAPAKSKPVHRLPSLSSVFPQGARPGDRLRVDVLGQSLDDASHVLWTTAGIGGRLIEVTPTRLAIEIEVTPQAAFGPHYFRVTTPKGASNVALFRVGDQPHIAEAEPNSTRDDAQLVNVPATINARLPEDGDFDFFRFQARAGETLVFDLRSARNGCSLDATMILWDAAGNKLGHDEDTFIWDPFLVHRFERGGEYVVAVEGRHTRNDPGFAYQLDIRRSAHIASMSPVALRPGAETEVTLFGAAILDVDARLEFDQPGFEGRMIQARGATGVARIRVPESQKPGPVSAVVTGRDGRSSPVQFVVDPTPPCPASAATGALLPMPCAIGGTAKYRQPERFRFQANAGQTLVFEGRARRFGSEADLALRVLDQANKQVAANDDGDFPGVSFNKDPKLVHKFKETGEYTLEVRNLTQVTGEHYPYHLVARPAEPRLELMLATDQPYIHPGETVKLKVNAARSEGHEGDVALEVRGLPPGMRAQAAAIASGKNEAEIELTMEPSAAPLPLGGYAALDVRAAGVSGPAGRSVRLSSGGGEGATFARVPGAVLTVARKPRFSLEAALTTVNLVRGSEAEAKVTVTRDVEFREPVEFELMNLPAGVSQERTVAGPERELVSIRLKASPDAALGRAARVVIRGKTTDGEIQDAPRISILVD